MYRFIFNRIKNIIPKISDTELIALRSGNTSLDRQILKGKIELPKFKRFRATFSDFDGEIMYCLIREIQPKVFFEISPDCGYSSIYITSALKKNRKVIF